MKRLEVCLLQIIVEKTRGLHVSAVLSMVEQLLPTQLRVLLFD